MERARIELKAHQAEVAAEIRKSTVLTRVDEALSALDNTVLALEKFAKHLASAEPGDERPCDACGRKGISLEQAGKTHAYLAKVVNELTRLLQFERGKPDQRTEVTGVADLMKALTNEQFDTVQRWYEEGMQRDAEGGRPN